MWWVGAGYKTRNVDPSALTPPSFLLLNSRPQLLLVISVTMAKDMTLLWASGSPPCWGVQIALEEKNLQGYNQKLLSVAKGEQKSKEVLEINPRGQFPAFKHKNTIVNESCAICFYLENQFKSQGTQLIPEGAAEVGLMYQLIFEAQPLAQKIGEVLYYNWKVPEGERHDSAVQRNKEALKEEMKIWEGHLQGCGDFLVGKSFSLADVIIFPVFAYFIRNGGSEERYPNVAAYYKKLRDRPSIKKTWPPTWIDGPGMGTLKDI
uniref:Glutathione S-transferase rho n=1 Tax=Oryzias latipes TaxID=8090 RepID=A0A3B3HH28_ORYLA